MIIIFNVFSVLHHCKFVLSINVQLTFIRAYLGVNSTSKGLMNGGGKALDGGDCVEDVSVTEEAILFEADAYALASHFLWAVWSIVQSRISTIQFAYLVCTSFSC